MAQTEAYGDSSDEDFETQVKGVVANSPTGREGNGTSLGRNLRGAILDGRADRVRHLIEKTGTANVICSRQTSRTALHFAAGCGFPEIVDFLCKSGAEVDKKDDLGLTPAKLAFFCGRCDVLDCFRRHGADLTFLPQIVLNSDNTPISVLRSAAVWGDAARAREVISSVRKSGTREGVRNFLTARDKYRRSPLTYASWYGHTDVVRVLLEFVEEGVELDAIDEDKQTPLAFAVGAGRTDIVQLLLEAGADAVVVIPPEITLISKAIFCNRIESLKALLKYVPSVDYSAEDGETGLMTAAVMGCPQAFHCLLESGANVNATTTSDGTTALMGACMMGKCQLIAPLVVAGADVNLGSTSDKVTPLKLAALWGKSRCVRALLLVKTLKIDATDSSGWTALHLSVTRGEERIVRLLLLAGASKYKKVQHLGSGKTFDAQQLALLRKNDGLAAFINNFCRTLADLCMVCIRQVMPSPLTNESVDKLPIPPVAKRKLLFR